MTLVKRCSRCKTEKSVSEFHRNRRVADGYSRLCKDCIRQDNHEYYLRHSEAIKDRVAGYRQRDIDADRERSRLYARTHAEQARQRARQWAMDNRERCLENKHSYRQERPEVWRRNNALRRARKKGAEIFGTVDFDVILARDKGRCWICGGEVSKQDLSFDHVVPLSKGGEHSERNIRVAHLACNCSKHDKIVTHQMLLF